MKTISSLGITLLFSIILSFSGKTIISQESDTSMAKFCINSEEVKLFNLINEYRKVLNLPEIPLSNSLSFVAKSHCIDLASNNPDTNTCNFHSWSEKGPWKACCFEKQIKDKSCMLNKPKEFTSYPGFGYEITYWENKEANADKAFDQWRETIASRSLMTNFKEWENYTWEAIGVGIYKGFAVVWFGEETDPEPQTKICGTDKVIENKKKETAQEQLIISKETQRFYVIFGSFNSLDEAKEQLTKYKEEGFKKAKIISKDDKFRISLSDYETMDKASTAKNELPSKFEGAWVLEY